MKRRFVVEFDWDDDASKVAHDFERDVLGRSGVVRINGWEGDARFVIALPLDEGTSDG